MTDANPGNDVTISLTPVFMNVVQTSVDGSGQATASYLISTAVCGTMAGVDVVSSRTARQIPGQPEDPKKSGIFDSLFGSASSTLSTLVGLIMLYEFVAKGFNKNQEAKEKSKSEAKDDNDLNDKEKQADEDMESEVSTELTSSPATATFETANDVTMDYSNASESFQKETMEQSMKEQEDSINDQINEQIENGATPTPEFETAFDNMQQGFNDAKSSIESGDFKDASSKLSDATSGIETAIQTEQTQMDDWEVSALQESADALKETTESTEALDKSQEDFETDRANESDDSGYDGDSESPATDPIEGLG